MICEVRCVGKGEGEEGKGVSEGDEDGVFAMGAIRTGLISP